jgi:hypothetical protein
MFIRPEQKELFEQLRGRSEALANIYWGGLRVLADDANPTHHQLAAHSFRELIAKCPEMAGRPAVYGDGMKQRLVPVRNALAAMKRAGKLTSDVPGDATGESVSLIVALEEFFEWGNQNRPKARIQTAVLLAQLAGAGPALPSDIVAEDVSAWMDSDEYFKLVAHHKKTAEQEEFIKRLYLVENVLLRRMRPRPVSDLDEIDQLIAEGENDN